MRFFKSLRFKLVLSFCVVGYLFALSVFIGQHFLNTKNQTMWHVPLWDWSSAVIEQPLQDVMALDNNKVPHAVLDTINAIVEKQNYQLEENTTSTHLYDVKVTGIAVVDKNAHLIAQAGNTNFTSGDIGSQLPLKMRDDLSDKLVGHYNSGLEKLSDNNYALIRRIETKNNEALGAVIIYHQWRENLFDQSNLEILLTRDLFNYFLLSFIVMLFTLPCGIIIIFWVTKRLRGRINHLYSTIAQWSDGELSQRIRVQSLDELGITFGRLNEMAAKLEQVIADNQQLAEENERQHIATQLHDTVKQQVFANNLLLATCKKQLETSPEEAKQNLAKIIEQNQSIFAQVNAMISTLQQDDASLDLCNELKQKLKDWQAQSDINVTQSIALPKLLTKAQSKAILQTVSEGLQNVSKHANATHVDIAIAVNKEQINITIANNHNQVQNQQGDIAFGQGLSLLATNIKNLRGSLSVEDKHSIWSIHVCLPIA